VVVLYRQKVLTKRRNATACLCCVKLFSNMKRSHFDIVRDCCISAYIDNLPTVRKGYLFVLCKLKSKFSSFDRVRSWSNSIDCRDGCRVVSFENKNPTLYDTVFDLIGFCFGTFSKSIRSDQRVKYTLSTISQKYLISIATSCESLDF